MDAIRIVIAGSDTARNKEIVACLHTLGHQVVKIISDGVTVLDTLQETLPDLLLLDSPMSELEAVNFIQEIEHTCHLPIILLADKDVTPVLLSADGSCGASCLVRPVSTDGIRVAIDLAISHYQVTQALCREVQDLKLALARRKIVERAKGVLMDRFQLSEGDAYRRLQQLSQRENRPMMEVAQAVIMLQTLWDEEGSMPPTL